MGLSQSIFSVELDTQYVSTFSYHLIQHGHTFVLTSGSHLGILLPSFSKTTSPDDFFSPLSCFTQAFCHSERNLKNQNKGSIVLVYLL